jgi:adenylate cyclase
MGPNIHNSMDTTQITILFADLSGFTALTETHGDQDAAEVAARFYELAQAALTGG